MFSIGYPENRGGGSATSAFQTIGKKFAGSHDSTGALTWNRSIVGMAPLSTGNGYWPTASDGGISRLQRSLLRKYSG